MGPKFRSSSASAPPSVANAGGSFFRKPASVSPNEPQSPFIEIDLPIIRELSSEQQLQVEAYRELEHDMKHSVYFLSVEKPKHDIERYSDKYLQNDSGSNSAKIGSIQTNLTFFPMELYSVYNPNAGQPELYKKKSTFSPFNVAKFDELEKDEQQKQVSADLEVEEEVEPVEEYDEEEFEAETDYNMSYFEPGDEYVDYDERGGGGDYDGDVF